MGETEEPERAGLRVEAVIPKEGEEGEEAGERPKEGERELGEGGEENPEGDEGEREGEEGEREGEEAEREGEEGEREGELGEGGEETGGPLERVNCREKTELRNASGATTATIYSVLVETEDWREESP